VTESVATGRSVQRVPLAACPPVHRRTVPDTDTGRQAARGTPTPVRSRTADRLRVAASGLRIHCRPEHGQETYQSGDRRKTSGLGQERRCTRSGHHDERFFVAARARDQRPSADRAAPAGDRVVGADACGDLSDLSAGRMVAARLRLPGAVVHLHLYGATGEVRLRRQLSPGTGLFPDQLPLDGPRHTTGVMW